MPRRLRQLRRGGWAGVALAAITATLVLAIALVLRYHQWAAQSAYVIAFTWVGASLFASLIQGARGVAQERAQGTWDALVLTRLGPCGIVFGKLGATLLPLWVLGLTLLPMELLLLRGDPSCSVLPLASAFGLGIVGAASLAGLGLYCSMRCWTAAGAQVMAFFIVGVIFGVAIPLVVGLTAPPDPTGMMTLRGTGLIEEPWYAGPAFAIAAGAGLLPGLLAIPYVALRFDRLDRARRKWV